MVTAEHPDYPADISAPHGDRCVCGGIRLWHAIAPHGCDDCECQAFIEVNADTEAPCEHQYTVYSVTCNTAVCEDCDEEFEPEDTRSFYRDLDTGRITW